MNLIHPVEPFKDPILMFGRNSDTGIADSQVVILHLDGHATDKNIIQEGIVILRCASCSSFSRCTCTPVK